MFSNTMSAPAAATRPWAWNVTGPLLTAAAIATIEALSRTWLKIPNPPAILLLLVVFSSFTGGIGPGLVSAILTWVYVAYFFATPGDVLSYTDENFRRVAVWAFTIPAMAVMVGILKRRADKMQAERARLENEARKGAILESALDCVISIDHRGRVVDFNPAAERTFGYTRAQTIGLEMAALIVPPSLRERHRRALAKYLVTGQATILGRRLELPALRADGTEFPIELTVTRIPVGGPPMFTAYVRDLTEHKRSEAIRQHNLELEAQYRRVQEANRLKSELLANMSHELRTPLNAIIGFSEILHDGKAGGLPPQQREFVGDILNSARHLLQLINDVLDLAKVEAGKMEFLPQPLHLPKLVREVCDVVRTLVAQKRLRLSIEIDEGVSELVLDGGKLKQVLYNYLSNAIKFTADEGSVVVRATPAEPDFFRLEVRDTGIGIRSEDQPRLFVEFQQLDAGAAKRYPGTGLGLALTKRLVEAQGGRVGVESQPGAGSTFYAVLPRMPARPASPTS